MAGLAPGTVAGLRVAFPLNMARVMAVLGGSDGNGNGGNTNAGMMGGVGMLSNVGFAIGRRDVGDEGGVFQAIGGAGAGAGDGGDNGGNENAGNGAASTFVMMDGSGSAVLMLQGSNRLDGEYVVLVPENGNGQGMIGGSNSGGGSGNGNGNGGAQGNTGNRAQQTSGGGKRLESSVIALIAGVVFSFAFGGR